MTPAEQERYLARIKSSAVELSTALREATDAGVSQAVILPQLMLIFRQSFGEPPAGFAIPGLPPAVPQ